MLGFRCRRVPMTVFRGRRLAKDPPLRRKTDARAAGEANLTAKKASKLEGREMRWASVADGGRCLSIAAKCR